MLQSFFVDLRTVHGDLDCLRRSFAVFFLLIASTVTSKAILAVQAAVM